MKIDNSKPMIYKDEAGKCIKNFHEFWFVLTQKSLDEIKDEVDTKRLKSLMNKKFQEEDLEDELERLGFDDDEIPLIVNVAESEPQVLNGWVNFSRGSKYGMFEMFAYDKKYFLFPADRMDNSICYGIEITEADVDRLIETDYKEIEEFFEEKYIT